MTRLMVGHTIETKNTTSRSTVLIREWRSSFLKLRAFLERPEANYVLHPCKRAMHSRLFYSAINWCTGSPLESPVEIAGIKFHHSFLQREQLRLPIPHAVRIFCIIGLRLSVELGSSQTPKTASPTLSRSRPCREFRPALIGDRTGFAENRMIPLI